METQLAIRTERTSPELAGQQFSLTRIPFMVYEQFSALYGIGEEDTSQQFGQPTRCRELSTVNAGDKRVFMLYVQKADGDAIEAKFALLSWKPFQPHFWESYEFEIVGGLSSGSWDIRHGNEYRETLTFGTRDAKPLVVDHPMTEYVALALADARNTASDPHAVSQTYVDHAPKPPR